MTNKLGWLKLSSLACKFDDERKQPCTEFMTEKILLNFDECMEVDNRFSYPYDLKKNPYADALVKV